MKNLELKAVAKDLARLREILRTLGARQEPRPLDQADWYFVVPHGRLKLRQLKGESAAELIFYARPDQKAARASHYEKLPTKDARGTLRLLRAMFAPLACVRKRRDLWLWREARVHLDRVERLGSFVEIEVPCARDVRRARGRMRILTERLGITPGDVIACSYADLLTRRVHR